MTRKTNRRTPLTVEGLEGRELQSGLATSAPLATTVALPYVEQDNLRTTGTGTATTGGTRSIIAIL